MNVPCLACGRSPSDQAHVKSRGAGGEISEQNCIPLCRGCHTLQHKVGWPRFLHRNPQVGFELMKRGWRLTMVGSGSTAVLRLLREK